MSPYVFLVVTNGIKEKDVKVMKDYKVLAVCGAGLATSTHVAKMIQTGLANRKIAANIRTCSVSESKGVIFNFKPDVIITTVATDAVTAPDDVKVFSGVPLLTGVGANQSLDEIAEYLVNK